MKIAPLGFAFVALWFVLTGSIFGSSAFAGEPANSGTDFRSATIFDVEATAQVLLDTHPGLLAISRDKELLRRWSRSLKEARRRAPMVDSESGRRAVLDGLVNAFRDPHISFDHEGGQLAQSWPQFTVSLASGSLKVAYAAPESGIEAGWQLKACDGRPAMEIARHRLNGFRAFESDAASLVSAVPWLFVDDSNPFAATKPNRCTFETDSGRQKVTLKWVPATFQEMLPGLVAAAMYQGRPGHRAAGRDGIIWISVPDLGPDTQKSIEAAAPLIAAAPPGSPVIFDLRTNTGGNSFFGDQLLALVYGENAVDRANETAGLQATDKIWRASDTTLKMVDARASEQDDNSQSDFWKALGSELRAAKSRGEPFNRPLRSVSPSRPSAPEATEPARENVYVFTDNFYSSSCLLLVSQLRSLGATHLGSPTTLSRRYTEAIRVPLPSSRSTLTTLVSVSTGGRAQIGPFVPDRPLPESVRSAEGVEAWIIAEVRRGSD